MSQLGYTRRSSEASDDARSLRPWLPYVFFSVVATVSTVWPSRVTGSTARCVAITRLTTAAAALYTRRPNIIPGAQVDEPVRERRAQTKSCTRRTATQQQRSTHLGFPPIVYECRRTTGVPCPTFIARTAIETSGMESNAPPPSANDAMDEWSLTALLLAVVASPASALLAEADRNDRIGDTDCVIPRWGSSIGELEMATAAVRGASMDRCAVPCREVCAFRAFRCIQTLAERDGRWWEGGEGG